MPAQQQMANSPYVGLHARETLDSYLRRTRRIRAVAVVAIVAVAAFAMATRLLDSVAGTLLYFLLLVLVVLLCALAVAKAFFGLQQVLTNDCDPQKLLDICLALMQRGRRGRGRALRNMQSICAVCCSNLGRSEDALDWVEAFETSGKLDVQLRLTAISVRLAAARRRADWEEVRHLSERAREMGAAGGRQARAAAELIAAQGNAYLLLGQGDLDGAEAALARVRENSRFPQHLVSVEWCEGELAEKREDLSAAARHFQYVAENGGTIYLRALAQSWLEEHVG